MQALEMNDSKLTKKEEEILKRWRKKAPFELSDTIKDQLRVHFEGDTLFDEPMAKHTYMKIGGTADAYLQPHNKEALLFALKLAHENNVPSYFHGFGANTLVKDGGLRGFVISLHDKMKNYEVIEETDEYIDVKADSGVLFSRLIHLAKDHGSLDLAPLVGIPGTVGGYVTMNAGTRERETKDVLRELTVITKDLEEVTFPREKLDFEYRKLKLPRTYFILSAVFRLNKNSTPEEVSEKMKAYQQRRQDTQPLNFPNLGSIFKNPSQEDSLIPVTAGQLIDEAGLKDIRVGGARISAKHGNFIINEGNATAKDVLTLIELIKDKVKSIHGIILETEIKVVGEDQ